VNSHNTTTLPVDSAISGACQADIGSVAPIAEIPACAADPSAKATARQPAVVCLKSRNSDAARTSNRAMAAAAHRDIDGEQHHQAAPVTAKVRLAS